MARKKITLKMLKGEGVTKEELAEIFLDDDTEKAAKETLRIMKKSDDPLKELAPFDVDESDMAVLGAGVMIYLRRYFTPYAWEYLANEWNEDKKKQREESQNEEEM